MKLPPPKIKLRNAIAGATTLAVAVTIVAAGSATAAPSKQIAPTQSVAEHCLGLSPNVVDLPFYGDLVVRQYETGVATVVWANVSAWTYRTRGTVFWTNLHSKRSGVVQVDYVTTLGGGVAQTDVRTGPGPVRFTTTAINHGLLTLPGPRCTGVATVR